MKKLSFNALDLERSKLSVQQKKQITGGFASDCLVACRCGTKETWVPEGTCHLPCFQMSDCAYF